jgi:hypothetical protein
VVRQEVFGATWAQEQQTLNDPPLYIYNYTLYVYTYIFYLFKKIHPYPMFYGHRSLPFLEAASITKVLN